MTVDQGRVAIMAKRLCNWMVRFIGVLVVYASTAAYGAPQVEYLLMDLGGGVWRYEYTLDNRNPGVAFNEFSVYFPLNTLSITSFKALGGWDTLVVPPDSSIPDGGFIDALFLSGMAPTELIPGFFVEFEFQAGVTPGVQNFELFINEPNSFTSVYSGRTTAPDGRVPEPATYLLVVLGLIAFTAFTARKRINRSGSLGRGESESVFLGS